MCKVKLLGLIKILRVVYTRWNQPKKLRWSGRLGSRKSNVIKASRCDQLHIVITPLSTEDTYQDPLCLSETTHNAKLSVFSYIDSFSFKEALSDFSLAYTNFQHHYSSSPSG